MKKLYEIRYRKTEYYTIDVVAESEEEARVLLNEAKRAGRASHHTGSTVAIDSVILIGEKE